MQERGDFCLLADDADGRGVAKIGWLDAAFARAFNSLSRAYRLDYSLIMLRSKHETQRIDTGA